MLCTLTILNILFQKQIYAVKFNLNTVDKDRELHRHTHQRTTFWKDLLITSLEATFVHTSVLS